MATQKPLPARTVRKRIDAAFWALSKLASETHAGDYFTRCYNAALAEEKGHRAMGARWTKGEARYRVPATTAARYFAVKWTLEGARNPPSSWADAVSLRDDARYGYAVRDLIVHAHGLEHPFFVEHAAVLELDYSEDIANG